MTVHNFTQFKQEHPKIFEMGGRYLKKDSCCSAKWGRLIIQWQEQHRGKQLLKRRYEPAIDLRAGMLCNDDPKPLIYLKFTGLLFGRPLHTVVRMVVHIWQFAHNLFNLIIKPSDWKNHLNRTWRASIDFLRSPIYGIALTALAAVALVFSLLFPPLLFELRSLSRTIERHLNWNNKINSENLLWTLAPCFAAYPIQIQKSQFGQAKEATSIRYDLIDPSLSEEERTLYISLIHFAKYSLDVRP